MTTDSELTPAPGRRARRHAVIVAIEAALIGAALYAAASITLDAVVRSGATSDLDSRLVVRVDQLAQGRDADEPRFTRTGVSGTLDQDDLSDAPIVVWWVAADGSVTAVDRAAPPLPRALNGVTGPVTATVGGRTFRVLGRRLPSGRLIVGSTTAAVDHEIAVLSVGELVLAPFVFVGFFIVAWLIGRRAVAPIEEARQLQLDFTADASHELRTPLSVIEAEIGHALSRERDGGQYRDALERISAESGRLRRIVDDLLWLARFEGRPAAPPSEQVDLTTLASASVTRFGPVAKSQGIDLRLAQSNGDDALVAAPTDWLDRLVGVLVDNACRYTPKGGSVTVGVSVRDARAVLTVDDSGPGIAPEERRRIFERFHRESQQPGGAGLGLAIADAVVTATGGRWEIGVAPGGGARMSVSWVRG